MIPHHALRVAREQAEHRFHRHVSFVIRGGAIISYGVNRGWNHAEVQALKKLWPSERRGTKVISVRLRRDGESGNSKPCPACEEFMREHGVKLVIYTDHAGKLVRMKL